MELSVSDVLWNRIVLVNCSVHGNGGASDVS
mgnify:FL=1|jgi:hypothetical protein